MEYIFEIVDKTGRRIRLTAKQWSHIKFHHSEVENPEEVYQTLKKPDSIILDEREDVENFFKFFKYKKQKSKFLKVIVKFLNNEGFVVTAHLARSIK